MIYPLLTGEPPADHALRALLTELRDILVDQRDPEIARPFSGVVVEYLGFQPSDLVVGAGGIGQHQQFVLGAFQQAADAAAGDCRRARRHRQEVSDVNEATTAQV